MGVRIVVVFQHDLAHVWSSDPKLGARILSQCRSLDEYVDIEGGKVVEVIDDTINSMLVMERYRVHGVAYESYKPGMGKVATCVKLLRAAARSLGYNLFRNYLRPSRLPEGK